MPVSKQFFARKNNPKGLSQHSEQDNEKNHSNMTEEQFLTNNVYTSEGKVLCRVPKLKGIQFSGRVHGCWATEDG